MFVIEIYIYIYIYICSKIKRILYIDANTDKNSQSIKNLFIPINQKLCNKIAMRIKENNTYPQINWSCYSSLNKLTQATSWVKKLKPNCIKWKRGEQTRENFITITAAEFQNSQHELICIYQNTSFKEEINNLKQEKHGETSSSIVPLSPFINSARLLCWWEIKSCEYITKFKASNFNFKTPPDSQITNH